MSQHIPECKLWGIPQRRQPVGTKGCTCLTRMHYEPHYDDQGHRTRYGQAVYNNALAEALLAHTPDTKALGMSDPPATLTNGGAGIPGG